MSTVSWKEVDGIRIRWYEEGEGEPLLLLHGWGASIRIWKHVGALLAKNFRVMAFDWPGFGESDKPEIPYTLSWYAEFLKKVLDAEKLGASRIVGHSMGGGILATFALDHPDRIKKVVLMTALVQGPTAFGVDTKLLVAPVIRRIGFWMLSFRWFRRFASKDFTYVAPFEDDLGTDLRAPTFAALVKPVTSMRETDLAPRLPALDVPCLVIGADHDQLLKPSQLEVQRTIPGAKVVVIENSGHCVQLDQPDALNRHLQDFFQA